ncbi:hypothetical protein [Enterococcus faecalis]|uniref:hypothetical protein n=1 Tax=Enterococcus faecalis TaxID=1351 RepID=UPI00094E4C3B|nr:hypothetical protein [Enterococcus faecalis]EKG8798334.1 hypothetical protein [Enterococcus faecalis]EKJ3567373.1 hypothetical protein [Enterococcus faecalis]
MSKKAVWLSDIEFIEMHSSDWERLESEAFEADESVQAQLSENQQVVLDWLKDRFNETEIKASCTGYLWKLHQSYIDDEADEAGIAYEELSYEEEAEMVRVFAEWFEQERK